MSAAMSLFDQPQDMPFGMAEVNALARQESGQHPAASSASRRRSRSRACERVTT